MNRRQFTKLLAGVGLLLAGCRAGAAPSSSTPERKDSMQTTTQTYTRTTPIETVRNDPVFGDYGRLIFPVERSYYSGDTLEQLHLTYYNNIDPDETVDICNTLRQRAADGQTIFYDIYTEDEQAADPDKADTGLFYFKGNPGAKFSICNAGGAFAYVGAMQDSFPHALELSRKEYNAFALIYRPGAQTACKDLARAIAFVFTHAEELEVDTSGYSLWGGSAGARMAAWLGSYGTASFGEQAYPQPGAVIMQYTGLGEVYGNEPPTYACVGDRDYIADERVMRWRIETIRSQGTPAEIEVFPGLAHGFGLGTGTSADTVATPNDFPAAYNYGTGKIEDYSRTAMLQKMPEPVDNATVLNTSADPNHIQALYLWEEGNVPAKTQFTAAMTGYFDNWDFRPYVTAIPVRTGVQPKGAVVLMAGGAYQFRGNYTDSLPTAAALRELGFQTFIVDYRLSPYTQEEGALDVARAVRFVRQNADVYGIDPDDIAVMGFSAGGIQAGEFLMHYDEDVNGTALDESYVPDALDAVPAHASAAGMIYSFYGRLSVGNMDPDWLAEGDLPPTFYVYGTEDPFYRQFQQQYDVIRNMGISAGRIVLNSWPHGFGSDGGWVNDYAAWLESVFANKEES